MDISVTQFRAHCLELIRQVESVGEVVEITSTPTSGSGGCWGPRACR